jgi:hypothetical protein
MELRTQFAKEHHNARVTKPVNGGSPLDNVDLHLIQLRICTAGAPRRAFGVSSTISMGSASFVAVDDNLSTVTVWTLAQVY